MHFPRTEVLVIKGSSQNFLIMSSLFCDIQHLSLPTMFLVPRNLVLHSLSGLELSCGQRMVAVFARKGVLARWYFLFLGVQLEVRCFLYLLAPFLTGNRDSFKSESHYFFMVRSLIHFPVFCHRCPMKRLSCDSILFIFWTLFRKVFWPDFP